MSKTDSIPGFSIEAMQSGNEQAFEVLFRYFYKMLYFFSKRITDDTAVAEEITTGTFLKLWQRRGDFYHIAAIKSFLYISARNACLDYLDARQRKIRHYRALDDLAGDAEEHILDEIFRTEVLQQIYHAMDQLPARYSEVLKLAYMEGLQNTDIARQLQVPLSTINTRKARGLAALKKLLPRHSFVLLLGLLP
ncbi:RNA polymerase sigma factor [Compostibacter hankyongensis]|uniref:RNA polymerase sigma-70 factor n=1 Tax=Compostibacter hankyongensis TaxID=1007089 RepID=A0ABP8FKX4_9BACT